VCFLCVCACVFFFFFVPAKKSYARDERVSDMTNPEKKAVAECVNEDDIGAEMCRR
jgi:hypothetical protein